MTRRQGRLAETMRTRERKGTGDPAVVMVHGFVISGEYFAPTVERLPASHHVLCPDLPGFGKSPPGARPLTVPQLATALTDWMGMRVPNGATVVANSFGCQVAAEAAMRRPDLVRRLVLVSPALDPATRSLRRLVPALWRETRSQSFPLQRMLVRHYLTTSPRRVLATLRHARWDRMEDKLPYIPCPTLVVWGTSDPVVSRRWAETAVRLLPDGRLRVVDGGLHAMNFESPDALAGALGEFIPAEEPV